MEKSLKLTHFLKNFYKIKLVHKFFTNRSMDSAFVKFSSRAEHRNKN